MFSKPSFSSGLRTQGDGETRRRCNSCARCRNHGYVTPLRGHKRYCAWTGCRCLRCSLQVERRRIQAALKRIEGQNEEQGVTPQTAPSSSTALSGQNDFSLHQQTSVHRPGMSSPPVTSTSSASFIQHGPPNSICGPMGTLYPFYQPMPYPYYTNQPSYFAYLQGTRSGMGGITLPLITSSHITGGTPPVSHGSEDHHLHHEDEKQEVSLQAPLSSPIALSGEQVDYSNHSSLQMQNSGARPGMSSPPVTSTSSASFIQHVPANSICGPMGTRYPFYQPLPYPYYSNQPSYSTYLQGMNSGICGISLPLTSSSLIAGSVPNASNGSDDGDVHVAYPSSFTSE